jgi:hypothetical protein
LGFLWSAVASFGAEPKPVTVSWPTLKFNVLQSQQKAPALVLSGKRASMPVSSQRSAAYRNTLVDGLNAG